MKTPSFDRLLIVGAGGHALVVGDCAQAIGLARELVFFDDCWPTLSQCGPWRVAGPTAKLALELQRNDAVFVAIGDNHQRVQWLNRLAEQHTSIATLVHPRAIVSTLAEIGPGSFVAAGAIVNAGAHIGRGCIINTAATVDHHCALGDGTHLGPGAHLAGNVVVGAGTLVGTGAVVRPGVEIGADAVIGAGAAVVVPVPSGAIFAGVPARPLRPGS